MADTIRRLQDLPESYTLTVAELVEHLNKFPADTLVAFTYEGIICTVDLKKLVIEDTEIGPMLLLDAE